MKPNEETPEPSVKRVTVDYLEPELKRSSSSASDATATHKQPTTVPPPGVQKIVPDELRQRPGNLAGCEDENVKNCCPIKPPLETGDNVVQAAGAETQDEPANGRHLTAYEMVLAVTAELNGTGRPPYSDPVWFELANGTLHKVPWIRSHVLSLEKITAYLEQMKKDGEEPFYRYGYEPQNVVNFQRAVISTASLVSLLLGGLPQVADVERVRHVLTEVRDWLPYW